MSKIQNSESERNISDATIHGEAMPPGAVEAKIDIMRSQFKDALVNALSDEIAGIMREENRRLLQEHTGKRPLLKPKDAAKTLNVSKRKLEDFIAAKELRVIWIGGQRRIHPDAIDAFMRKCVR